MAAATVLLILVLAGVLAQCSGGLIGQITSSSSGSGGSVTTVPPAQISVTISPSSISLLIGTTNKFAAITNADNPAVTWSVNGVVGGNSTVGTIGGSGLYVAPSSVPMPSSVMITATSVADPSKSGSALVVITQMSASVQVNVTPSGVPVQTGGNTLLNAQVTGTNNTGVTWLVNGIPGGNATVGMVSPAGLYTAPAILPNPAEVTVTATSVADPTASGTAIVTVQQRVQVSVTPTVANATVGTQIVFMDTVTGTVNLNVQWSVAGIPGGNAIVGQISQTGTYTAPANVPNPATVTVTVTSLADQTAFASALVTVLPLNKVAVAVGPATATVAVNAIQQFNATVTGSPNAQVTWLVNGIVGGNGIVGTISLSGLYTGPSVVPLPNTVTVTAVSLADPNASGLASVMVIGSSLVSVVVSPPASNLAPGGLVQFFATVSGTANQAVTWRVNGISGGTAATGTITAAGVYQLAANIIPTNPPTVVTITASSVVDPTASGIATVTIIAAPVPVSVQVSPPTASLHVNNQFQFSAAVTGTMNMLVDWSVNGIKGGNLTVGTISAMGVYIAPGSVPAGGMVTVTATSQQDNTKSSSAMVTILPQATITLTPAMITVQTGLGAQFFTVVTGLANTGVNFSVNNVPGGNATVGTISASGLYIAPATVPNPATVTVKATSVVDATVTASSTVTIAVPVTVTTAPPTATIGVGQPQAFNAMVTGTANQAVTWSVNGIPGGNATVGTIDVNGNYLAPASLMMTQSFTITATSVVNAAAMGSSTVTVTVPISVVVSPKTAMVLTNGMLTFAAAVSGTANTAVNWSTTGGMISANGQFTAPAAVPPPPGTVTVTATSQADMTKKDTATVTVTAPVVTISVSPNPATVSAPGGMQQFTATVGGTANMMVNWSVIGAGNGTIDGSGLYTAPAVPPVPATITVRATSQADMTKTADAMVTIVTGAAVAVGPANTSVVAGQQQQFTATVTGTANTNVTWSASAGTISNTGLFTAPAPATVPNAFAVTITATTVMPPGVMGSTTTTVLPLVSVSVAPNPVTLLPGQSQAFTATVTGAANGAVTWSVNGIIGGSNQVGTVSAMGLYTAPATAPTPNIVSVTATSVADPTKSATAAVTIQAPVSGIFVSVFPRNRTLPIGRAQQYTAQVFMTVNTIVNWQVNGVPGGNAMVGTIDATGLYTPPATLPAAPKITITAVSQADMTKSDTQKAQIVAGVTVAPASDSLHVGESVQFTAAVTGVANTAVTWAVEDIPGGNNMVGMITNNGHYTAPATVPNPGMVRVTATSVADPTRPGVANEKIYPAKFFKIFPATVSVLPGGTLGFQYYTNIYYPTTMNNFGLVVTWSVNGVPKGNAAVGTIDLSGTYFAPLTPQTVTVSAKSVINPAFFASATVNVTPAAGSSSVTFVDNLTKIRPYDVVSGTSSISLAAAQQEYADWQVMVTANGEDLTNVDVNVSNFTDGLGNSIPASRATIYFQKPLNVFYHSRVQWVEAGEWPDPLVPKVDPFVGETRNAFPFIVNRISPAYKKYPQFGGNTGNFGLGAGTAQSSGVYTGSVLERFDVVIDNPGAVGVATFKWSTDGGKTFQQAGIPTSANPVPLSDGVSVSFKPGNIAGVGDFLAGNTFWIFAGPFRNQGVWVDLYVPMGTPAGNYTGTVDVSRAGAATVSLPVTLQVYGFAIPVSSTVPNWWGSYWEGYPPAHFLSPDPGQRTTLGQLYGVACLINRMTCGSTASPSYTYNADGTVATMNYNNFDPVIGPLMDGTNTPHGEQQSTLSLPGIGATRTQFFFGMQAFLAHLVSKGWRSRLFDYTRDEPGPASDWIGLMFRATLVRSVDNSVRTLVTADASGYNFNGEGYISRYVSNFTNLGEKDYQRGPSPNQRAFYDSLVANGDEVWWYDSCSTTGCGGGGQSPLQDNYPNTMADTSALMNRVWGVMSLVPYRTSGYLYYSVNQEYQNFVNMNKPKVDLWDSIYLFGGNGDGTLFYPGRPSNIGGTTDIPVESLRMKMIRDAYVDMEYGKLLQSQSVNDAAFMESSILALESDIYTFDPDPASWQALRIKLGQKIK